MLTSFEAISEHQRQSDTIKYLQQQHHSVVTDMEMQRREVAALRMENSQLRGELTAVSAGHAASSHSSAAPAAQFQARDAQRPELPPLRSLSGEIPQVPESMTGVQYSEPPRMGGYRAPDARY